MNDDRVIREPLTIIGAMMTVVLVILLVFGCLFHFGDSIDTAAASTESSP